MWSMHSWMFQMWNHPNLPTDVHQPSDSSQVLLAQLWFWPGRTRQQVTTVEGTWPWPAILCQGHHSHQDIMWSGSRPQILKAMLLPACSISSFKVGTRTMLLWFCHSAAITSVSIHHGLSHVLPFWHFLIFNAAQSQRTFYAHSSGVNHVEIWQLLIHVIEL